MKTPNNTRGVLKVIRKNAQRVYEQQRTEKYVKDKNGDPVSPEWIRRKIVSEALAVLGLWGDYSQLNEALTFTMASGPIKKVALSRHFSRLGKAAKKKGLLAPVLQIAQCAKGISPFYDTDMRKVKFVNNKGL